MIGLVRRNCSRPWGLAVFLCAATCCCAAPLSPDQAIDLLAEQVALPEGVRPVRPYHFEHIPRVLALLPSPIATEGALLTVHVIPERDRPNEQILQLRAWVPPEAPGGPMTWGVWLEVPFELAVPLPQARVQAWQVRPTELLFIPDDWIAPLTPSTPVYRLRPPLNVPPSALGLHTASVPPLLHYNLRAELLRPEVRRDADGLEVMIWDGNHEQRAAAMLAPEAGPRPADGLVGVAALPDASGSGYIAVLGQPPAARDGLYRWSNLWLTTLPEGDAATTATVTLTPLFPRAQALARQLEQGGLGVTRSLTRPAVSAARTVVAAWCRYRIVQPNADAAPRIVDLLHVMRLGAESHEWVAALHEPPGAAPRAVPLPDPTVAFSADGRWLGYATPTAFSVLDLHAPQEP